TTPFPSHPYSLSLHDALPISPIMPIGRLTTFYCHSGKPKRSCLGFSLIELLFAITIILIIAALAVPKLYGALYVAKVSRAAGDKSEEHTSELQSRFDLVCRLL